MECFFCFFFFVSVYSITSRNNDSISNFWGGFQWKSEYPWCIIEVKSKYFPTVLKKIKKNKKKKKSGQVGTALLYIRCRVDHYIL
ncbi:Uncharacterized protein FWK35_00036981 [Aphis craccivora]|uniref:Secreted protein n=1 Tax=Aphis craccivora TaxID=307492 RepID=A0A6G0Y3H4_APHCR|nr:Uncharacterized protein FWK35_00036981 [Aphis craccivora]